MNLTIIGTGYVGLVTGAVFAERGHAVLCVDKVVEKIDLLNRGGMPIYEPGIEESVAASRKAGRLRFGTDIAEGVRSADVIFLCVDTPPHESGSADLSSIEAASNQIARHLDRYKVIVEKSTVPVKTGERVRQTIARKCPEGVEFDVASNPEFLREGSALADARKPDRIVLGVSSERAGAVLRSLYASFEAPLIVTDIPSAEIIKHAANSFLAMKISFANAVSRICELAGADVAEVMRGVGLDRRIGPAFLDAGFGYGGSCFPKDVAAFHRIAQELGYDFRLLQEVQKINEEQRQHVLHKLEQEVWILKGKRIALLGLAFK
ncbi:MAG: UDP-glucose/GDP-mannose dehydrogenase family protein, partial [Planctomycetes bacterium]|nr:UDP-glucose/GDP-mannose dehydrogenase family protein [Planctomycetota bacterium]